MSLLSTPGKRPAGTAGVVPFPSLLLDGRSTTTHPSSTYPSLYLHSVDQQESLRRWQHLYVLPVLLLEFLALALTRAVLPSLLLNEYGNRVYLVMGCADFVRGFLAFFTCPIVGKVSDIVGRRVCLFVTVMGTCAPVCSLALFSWRPVQTLDYHEASSLEAADTAVAVSDESTGIWPWNAPYTGRETHPLAIAVFILLLSLSGVFASTFTLVFAYISDTVKEQDERVSAYGLALATFGLSFTLGPMLGGYLAKTNIQYVFVTSLLLTVLDLVYIYFFLPESRLLDQHEPHQHDDDDNDNADDPLNRSSNSAGTSGRLSILTLDHNFSWNPVDTLRIIVVDPFLRQVGKVAFLYYTGLWALLSTLSVYAVKRFHLTPERLGELISVLGLSTMIAEAVLVRILVPLLGEKRAMKLGLVSFALQCLTLGFAYKGWQLFICAAFSVLGNLVYPSLTSLVSGSVEPDAVGEALGAINGIKALTEGIGPLVFGTLMTISEKSSLPGWPYLLAAVLVMAAYLEAGKLPDIDDDDFVHELSRKSRSRASNGTSSSSILMRTFANKKSQKGSADEELDGLLSEIDDSDDEN